MTDNDFQTIDVAYHRNGISGEGFWHVLFSARPGDDQAPEKFAATVFNVNLHDYDEEVFPEDKPQPGYISVLRVAAIVNDVADDCWRGDHYETQVREAIKTWKVENDWPS